MSKSSIADEVQVLHFFEESSVEKAEIVFNIVADRMQERLRANAPVREGHGGSAGSGKRRAVVAKQPTPGTGGPRHPVCVLTISHQLGQVGQGKPFLIVTMAWRPYSNLNSGEPGLRAPAGKRPENPN